MTDKLIIPCDAGQVSDGYHTFDELYEHRLRLFLALMLSHPKLSWRAEAHDDGSSFDGWFVAGMCLPSGDITYHLPNRLWDRLDGSGIKTMQRAPRWDGHTPDDVLLRLTGFMSSLKHG